MKVKIISTPEYQPIKYEKGGLPPYDDKNPDSLPLKRARLKEKYEKLKSEFNYEETPIDWDKATQKEMDAFVGKMQSFLYKQSPETVEAYMNTVNPTNLGRKNSKSPAKGFNDNLWWYRFPEYKDKEFTNQAEYDSYIKDKKPYTVNGKTYYHNPEGTNDEEFISPSVKNPPPAQTNATATPLAEQTVGQQNPPGLNNPTDTQKPKYKQQGLPFYQAAPELAGFISALNTYNYQTPDYTHWEINPATLNIQSQLQSIDSSQNAINSTTTGNPQVDAARKQAAFTQSLAAKQQAFSNKQNYDAEGRFKADSFNIDARTREQNLDTLAWTTIYNEYMPLAKDYAAGERLRAISSLTTKVAKNKANESLKSLYLDNFYQNFQLNGTDINKVVDSDIDTSNPYSKNKPTNTTSPVTTSETIDPTKSFDPSVDYVRLQKNAITPPNRNNNFNPNMLRVDNIPTEEELSKIKQQEFLKNQIDDTGFMYGGTVKKLENN